MYEQVFAYCLRKWPRSGKGSLAVLDQALIFGSNFLAWVLLARWLAPDQYGSYAVAFTIFVFLSFFARLCFSSP